jgi:two-component system sensor histidine kinase KdpD
MARGSLRIYLGASPGVGKTYKMLGEGVRRKERGADVVIGLVETHGRKQTAEQIAHLEVMPRREVSYRDTVLYEMDVDAIVKRRPEVVLVDEYAHTNAPGSPNEKRWQDVEQLLDAGIDVISTLNIQHLESLNDVIQRITGIEQRETVPDERVRKADQLELVDMAPEAIRRRLAHGNIYPAERVDAALANYFRPGNLGALRELALLWLADRVEESLTSYLDAHGISETWETRERVVVGLTGYPSGEAAIRRAARMAGRVGGELIGIHVSLSDGLAGPNEQALAEQRKLVVELGGTVHDIIAHNTAEGMAAFARQEKATQIVLGASRRSRWHELVHGSFVARLTRLVPEVDVHVIARTGDEVPVEHQSRRREPVRRRTIVAWLLTVFALPLLIAVTLPFRDTFDRTPPGARRGVGDRGPRRCGRRHRGSNRCVAARQLVLRRAVLDVDHRRHRERHRARRVHRGCHHHWRAGRHRLAAFPRSETRAARSRGVGSFDHEPGHRSGACTTADRADPVGVRPGGCPTRRGARRNMVDNRDGGRRHRVAHRDAVAAERHQP